MCEKKFGINFMEMSKNLQYIFVNAVYILKCLDYCMCPI